ncbi:MAG TPA: hypothetical protein VK177_09535 [Flavobacteriales bacterium]|nr:hypothetical protein [Flavobacteriales bacterium]
METPGHKKRAPFLDALFKYLFFSYLVLPFNLDSLILVVDPFERIILSSLSFLELNKRLNPSTIVSINFMLIILLVLFEWLRKRYAFVALISLINTNKKGVVV